MRNRIFTLLTGLVLLSLSACQDKDPVQQGNKLSLTFNGSFREAPLLMYEKAYPYDAGMDIKFQLFHFYLSELVLLPEQNSGAQEQTIYDVALISFKDVQSEEAAQKGVTLTIDNVPPGRYSGVRFGIGLSPRLNDTQPGDYTPGHPLTDNYWSWAKGYVFFKIEGNADNDGDGKFTDKLTFHIGTNDFYRVKTFEQPLEIKSTGSTELQFVVDLHEVLAPSSSNFVDFRTVTQDHTTDLNLAAFLANNLQNAIKINK